MLLMKKHFVSQIQERSKEYSCGKVSPKIVRPTSSNAGSVAGGVWTVEIHFKMATTRAPTLLLTTARFESTNSSSNGTPLPHNENPPGRPLLSVTKPSWVVRTESNVWREKVKKPDPPCVVCRGSGRVDCPHCRGRGRTNEVHLAMLPKGAWPKWCRTCGGSGLGYCSRCLGTGEYRYIMGFHFMKRETECTRNYKKDQVRDNPRTRSAEDLLHNDEQSDSRHET